ncbi:MAG: hypothetical protein ABIN95_10480 [Mucilaginibacter sp.]
MKKLFILPVIIGMLVTGVYAADKVKKDDDKNGNVSYAVINQFKSDFRDATNVNWTVTPNSQRAEFIVNGVKKSAFYNLDGTYLGTTQKVAYNTISLKAQKEIADKYIGYTVSEVIELQTGESVDHFVDLKSAEGEVLVRVAPTSAVYFFQKVK